MCQWRTSQTTGTVERAQECGRPDQCEYSTYRSTYLRDHERFEESEGEEKRRQEIALFEKQQIEIEALQQKHQEQKTDLENRQANMPYYNTHKAKELREKQTNEQRLYHDRKTREMHDRHRDEARQLDRQFRRRMTEFQTRQIARFQGLANEEVLRQRAAQEAAIRERQAHQQGGQTGYPSQPRPRLSLQQQQQQDLRRSQQAAPQARVRYPIQPAPPPQQQQTQQHYQDYHGASCWDAWCA